MAGSTLKQGTGKELRKLFAMMTSAIGETIGSLVGRPLVLKPGDVEVHDKDALVGSLTRPCVVARAALGKDFAGKTLCAVFDVQDAAAMAGLLMLTPDPVIEQRRAKNTLEGEDTTAFGELGSVLCSGIGTILRDQVPNADLRWQDHGQIQPASDKDNVLTAGWLAVLSFRMKVGDFPETTGWLVTDLATGEAWNKGPLENDDGAAGAGAQAKAAPAAARGDEDLEGIPAVPVRGVLAAFVLEPEVFRTLRRSCRRVGLELRRHGRAEIPNPAAHKNQIVLLDVPTGEDKRFDWCHRIKEFASTKVVLMIHHPSRARVTQAFLARADVILGFPCDEGQLSHKLGAILPDEPPGPPPAPPAPPAPQPPPAA